MQPLAPHVGKNDCEVFFMEYMVKKNYKEGSWFAVPLEPNGYVIGLAARNAPRGAILGAYFFGKRYDCVPELSELNSLQPEDAVKILQVGDLGLINGEWTVIGRFPDWDRSKWPIPKFLMREPITNRCWMITYSDDDPNRMISRQLITDEKAEGLEPDVLSGYKAAEKILSKLLSSRNLK